MLHLRHTCTVQPDTTEFREIENFTPDREVRFAVVHVIFQWFCNTF